MTAVEFDNVSIVFGEKPQKALPFMDEGMDRATVKNKSGQVLGVHNCTLTVEEGETLVLMGLSGSGKSTLLRAINGLNPVVRGAVRVSDGSQMVDITNADGATLRRMRQNHIAMVFQQFGLLPWRTVRHSTSHCWCSKTSLDSYQEQIKNGTELLPMEQNYCMRLPRQQCHV